MSELLDGARDGSYQVVARKYRPQTFEALVGQPHIGQGLSAAITTNRVGHAYLFTGARGTGKTSTARIFAKALNCERGPTPAPCQECDICKGIAAGDDLDVIEIDAASNRGIDEIRQLRSNVSKTPSRARYKIYIIDEVHMLTKESFNALLKTLEEPPAHVKFVLCTTDPDKIPITVRSRCQRFDFMPVATAQIQERLEDIAPQEGSTAEPAALQMIARRAAGSMRDSQSLLEQLLSVCQGKITVADVDRMFGTADSRRLSELIDAVIARDGARALIQVDEALRERVDAGQLAEQLVEYLRDMLTAALGASPDILLASSPDLHTELAATGQRIGVETLFAMFQILDHALVRMRQSVHPRVLLEVAIVRMCRLDALDDLASVLAQLQSGTISALPSLSMPAARPTASAPAPQIGGVKPPSPPEKKTEPITNTRVDGPEPTLSAIHLTSDNASEVWRQALDSMEDMSSDRGRRATQIATAGPNLLVVGFPAEYSFDKESCERPTTRSRFEQAVAGIVGQTIKIDFQLLPGEPKPVQPAAVAVNKRQLMKEREKHPLVQAALETFGAEMVEVQEPRRSN